MDRRARIAAIFRTALDYDGPAREAFIEAECQGDPGIESEVRALLQSVGREDSPLDQPVSERLGPVPAELACGPPERVGPFGLLRLLGRGGMGEVWLAERTTGGFVQRVALKWVDRGRLGRAGLERFARERELLARLEHPAIARVIDGGEVDGTPWFAMEYVDGVPIDRYMAEARPDLRATLDLILPVIEAVQHLHRHLVVHRDLKPSNVLVDREGRSRLIDLGIAKELSAAAEPTEGLGPMSLAYAAPEQVAGGPITLATDIWGLGALLHELLSGRSPHQGAASSLPQLIDAIARGEPTLPSEALAHDPTQRAWSPAQLRGDLDLIVQACLKREPERRYASAAQLAEDLRRWRKRMPITARRDSAAYRVRRFVARHPFGTLATAVAVAGLITSTAFAWWQAERAEQAAALAARERDAARTEARRQEVLREHFAAVIGRATASGEPIPPEALLDLVANAQLTRAAHDPPTHRALVLALADALAIRADFRRLGRLLEQAASTMAGASAAERALYHKHLALVGLRLGNAELTDEAIARAMAAIAEGGLEQSMMAADLLGFRAQRARATGDLAQAVQWSAQAAAIARSDNTASPLERGIVIANYGVNLVYAGLPEAAIAAIDEADAIWSAGGVEANAGAASARAVRANAKLAAGLMKEALAEFDAIESTAPPGDPEAARTARQMGRARALAWLGQAEAAAAEAAAAARRHCAAVGADSADCRRAVLAHIEVLAVSGRYQIALAEAERLRDAGEWLPSARMAVALARLASGDREAIAVLRSEASDGPPQDRIRARTAARFALLGTRVARGRGDLAAAQQLVEAAARALDRAQATEGFDRPWLLVEGARARGHNPPDSALDALRGLGFAHFAD